MKLTKSFKKVKTFSLIGMMLYITVACNSSKSISPSEEVDKQWEIVKIDKKNNDPTWIIYSRKEYGTNIYDFKIEGNIDITPKAYVNSFKQDIIGLSNDPKKDTDYEYITYKIVNESENSISIYAIHNEPFPLKDTEMNITYTFYSDSNGIMAVRWKETWNEYPVKPSKKLSRVESFRGSRTFRHASASSYKAVSSVQFDLKGMPLWLAKPMIVKFLKRGLNDMRELKSN